MGHRRTAPVTGAGNGKTLAAGALWSTPVPIVPRLLDEVAARFGIEVLPTV
jgi:hypothetical protein